MTKHSPEQVITKLRAAEVDLAAGLTIGQVCQKLAISEQTFHRGRAQYGGMKADEAKRLKELEVENDRLKRLVAQLALDKQMLQEVVQKKWWPPASGGRRCATSASGSACRSGGPAGCWANTARRSVSSPRPAK